MRITNLKLPKMGKLTNAKAGELVTIYTSHLVAAGTYIVAADNGHTYGAVNIDSGQVVQMPMPPVAGGWGSPSPVALFNPTDGRQVSAPGEMRCEVHKGAAVVLDYVEGA